MQCSVYVYSDYKALHAMELVLSSFVVAEWHSAVVTKFAELNRNFNGSIFNGLWHSLIDLMRAAQTVAIKILSGVC